MIRRPPRSTQGVSSAASDVYKRQELIKINNLIRNHPVEIIGKHLRSSMTSMKQI